jgi:hypothetical protein
VSYWLTPDVAQLHGDEERRRHFHCLPHEEQLAAIRRLAATGLSEATIASATALSVEMVRAVLNEAGHG